MPHCVFALGANSFENHVSIYPNGASLFHSRSPFLLRLERVDHWERIASRGRPAFSSHLCSRETGYLSGFGVIRPSDRHSLKAVRKAQSRHGRVTASLRKLPIERVDFLGADVTYKERNLTRG